MRKILLFSFLFIFGMGSNAEAQKAAKKGFVTVPNRESVKAEYSHRVVAEPCFNGEDLSNINLAEAGAVHHTAEQLSKRTTEEALIIGSTYYDLQVNTTMCRRVVEHPDGRISVNWIMSQTQDDELLFADRGTGYNHFDGTDWGQTPLETLESVRSGWPNLSILGDGNEIIASHGAADTGWNPHVLIGAPNAGVGMYSEESITNADGLQILWMRTATVGNTIHMIGCTLPTANDGGVEYSGVDGHILYFRSTDNGASWDKQGAIIPGLDSSNFSEMPADSYTIDANENGTVAFGIWNDWGNTEVFISNDGGENWTRRIVLDHPLDFYDPSVGYTPDDIILDLDGPAGGEEPTASDSMAVRSSDNSGSIIVDADGKVHAAFGEMYYTDIDFTDDLSSLYPSWSGMLYWNSDMPDDEQILIADLMLDPMDNTDTVFTLCSAETPETEDDGPGRYRSANMTSFPMFSEGTDGILYITYAAVLDNFCSTADDQNIRHINVIHSLDGGANWSDPYDVINADTYEDYEDVEFQKSLETVYPSAARGVDDKLHITYMQDGRPGLAVETGGDDVEINYIYYVAIDKADIVSGIDVVDPEKIAFNVYPNPAVAEVNITYTLAEKENVEISLMNIMGQKMTTAVNEPQSSGAYSFNVNVQNYPAGVYLVQINTGDKVSTQKLIIE